MNWEQIIAMNAPVITVMIGLFVWLRHDIAKVARDLNRLEDKVTSDLKRLEGKFDSEIKRLEDKLDTDLNRLEDKFTSDLKRLEDRFEAKLESEIRRLEDKMDAGFLAMDERLRQVEHEQARMAGLLEGLALTGKLPSSESQTA